jgi:hypothetical protein
MREINIYRLHRQIIRKRLRQELALKISTIHFLLCSAHLLSIFNNKRLSRKKRFYNRIQLQLLWQKGSRVGLNVRQIVWYFESS